MLTAAADEASRYACHFRARLYYQVGQMPKPYRLYRFRCVRFAAITPIIAMPQLINAPRRRRMPQAHARSRRYDARASACKLLPPPEGRHVIFDIVAVIRSARI